MKNKNTQMEKKVDNLQNKENLVENPQESVDNSLEQVAITDTLTLNQPQVAISEKPKRKKGFRYGCYLFVKRTFDILASSLVLILFCWLYLIIAIIVKCGDGGKVFYRQKRIGKNGKETFITKFRSMKKDADNLEKHLTPEQLEQYHKEFKLDNDPRITKFGGFLRRTSLDEIPQIWDILMGRISVVGPRPISKEETEMKYGENAQKLLSVKPGLVGWWAVNGRSKCTYDSGKRQELELYYVDNCCLWLDIKIIFKAIIKVLVRDGAQ